MGLSRGLKGCGTKPSEIKIKIKIKILIKIKIHRHQVINLPPEYGIVIELNTRVQVQIRSEKPCGIRKKHGCMDAWIQFNNNALFHSLFVFLFFSLIYK